ncbi:HTH-type transcriptional regulator RutR [Salinicola endophyticus]|uniref:HTH-type transcriptional regulator RutR n=1 Tax=Salinicola endophyticus TaxID=1949083 RepID=UPI000DA1CC8C|nr:HTH-type transcriptional regulator RutR [Salinicola endophyticus]
MTSSSRPATARARASEARRQTILDAALSLFSQFGLHGASLDAIAELAGVSKTNLLYHYASKETLYLAVFERILQSWLVPMDLICATTPPETAIRRYIELKLELARDQPQASRLYCLEVIQGAPLLGKVLADQRRMMADKSRAVQHWIDSGQLSPVDPYHLIYLLWSTTQHYADFAVQIQAISGQDLSDPDFFAASVDNVQRIVLGGLLPRAGDA